MAFGSPFGDFIFARIILMKISTLQCRWHLLYLPIMLIVTMLLSGCDNKPTRSNSVKTLTQSQDFVFEPVVKGEPVVFPRDYGEHPEYLAE